MPVKAPAERNFRRAPAKAARRRRFRPRLSWTVVRRVLSLLLFVFGVYQSLAFAFTTPLLRVNRISVHGNVRLSSGEVQALVDDLRGTSILRVDLEAFRRRLVESPWIAEVGLRRVLPSTVEIFVSERRPIGLCRMGPDLYLVDETGTVIDQFGPQYAEFDLPIVDGLGEPGRRRHARLDRHRPRRARGARHRRARAQPADRAAGCRRSTWPTRTTRSCCSKATRRSCTSARTGSSSASSRTWSCRRRCASGSTTSITSTCGSSRASTCARRPTHGPRRRAAGSRGSGGRKEAFLVAHTIAMNRPTAC